MMHATTYKYEINLDVSRISANKASKLFFRQLHHLYISYIYSCFLDHGHHACTCTNSRYAHAWSWTNIFGMVIVPIS